MKEVEAETMAIIDMYYEPVKDKPGYVWLSKSNCQIISIETLAKSLEKSYQKGYYDTLQRQVESEVEE